MLTTPPAQTIDNLGTELEAALTAVEQRLGMLGEALRERDSNAIEQHAGELHSLLADAVNRFALAARSGGVPPSLRRRLANASGQVAAHRESLARATAALDRAIDVLMPDPSRGGMYSAQGNAERGHQGNAIQA
ncbi:MAG TPA: hypothetical protein VFP68_07335 [Burkholderiaceae bacterium]|nr:hypothetical protein [Burkholderiaceae bacterium]